MKVRLALVLLLVAVFFRGVVWMASIPIWEAPDEPAHFDYVQSLAENHAIPTLGVGQFSAEVRRSAADVGLTNVDWLSQQDFPPGVNGRDEAALGTSSPADRRTGTSDTAGAYSPVYYLAGVPFYYIGRPWGLLGSLFGLRLFDVLLAVFATYLTVLAGRQLWPKEPGLALIGGALLAFQPMFDQSTTMVNNDAGAYAVGAAFIALALAAFRRRPSLRLGLGLGALAGLGFVVKPIGGMLVVALLPFLLVRLFTARSNASLPVSGRVGGVRAVLRELGGMATGGLATAGWWVVLSYINRGGPFAQFGSQVAGPLPTLRAYLHMLRAQNFHYLFRAWVDWLWGDFGWLNAPLPMAVDLVIEIVVGILLIGLVVWFIRWNRSRQTGPALGQVLFLVASVLAGMAFLHLSDALFYIHTGGVLLQGRYLLVVGSALMFCLMTGLFGLVPARMRGPAATSLLAAMFALNVLSLGVIWHRFYT